VWPAPAGQTAAVRGSPLLTERTRSLVIDPQFCGPADRANGGYIAGILARIVEPPLQLTLRKAVPVGHAIHVRETPDGGAHVLSGDDVLAEARSAPLDLAVPEPPSHDAAVHAARNYIGFHDHPFPRCFVCGPLRAEGDGLRIFAGPVPDEPMVAAPWTPHAAFAADGGQVRHEVTWAALDCPGCFAALLDRPAQAAVLGRITAHVTRAPNAGEPVTVIGWPIAHDGRKHHVGTALVGADGELIGRALATWVDVPFRDALGGSRRPGTGTEERLGTGHRRPAADGPGGT
jgi:hypothetical protein